MESESIQVWIKSSNSRKPTHFYEKKKNILGSQSEIDFDSGTDIYKFLDGFVFSFSALTNLKYILRSYNDYII